MATRDQLRIEAALDVLLASRLTEAERALVEAWSRAWDMVRPEVEAALIALAAEHAGGRVTRTALLRDARAQAALEAVYGALDDMAQRSPALAGTFLTGVVAASSDGAADMVRAGLSGVLRSELRSSVVGADAGQVAAIIERSTRQITSRNRHLAAEAQAAIRQQMMRGVAVGENPRRAAALAVRGIEDQWNGGLARARTIARTEMIDAHRTAAQRVEEANSDVLAGWEWLTHGDERTCRACLSQHGSRHDVDEPGPLGHPNCRCARVPVTKSWEELGFPGMRDAQSRTGTAEELVESMPADDLRSILGDDGYEAWQRGDYPISEWSRRKSTDGWRDSFVPTVYRSQK
ncbi:phage minor head protein [Brachybacterium paraconglomeratum]|uniref:phage minor head protein n=1 Tax=Brachybacterium paraconglomeratum TaxID=173362 RepID=UPI00026C6909|nr:phage minor head protein [Brachybacterium paraconglomeratum]